MALDSLSAQSGLSPATLAKIIPVLAQCPALDCFDSLAMTG